MKLGDFNLSRKKNKFDEDYFEGDSTYMAPEILEATRIKELTEKCDIFSLGLTIFEILFKIDLPQNGLLWHQIRNEKFVIPQEFLEHSNLRNIPNEFFRLIYGMMNNDPNKRLNISQMFEDFEELKKRLESLNNKCYINSYEDFVFQFDKKLEFSNYKSKKKNHHL